MVAEKRHVVCVVRVWFVAGVKSYKGGWLDAAHLVPVDVTDTGEVLRRVGYSTDVPAVLVEGVRMDVEPTPVGVCQHEVARPGVRTGLLCKVEAFEQPAQRGYLRMRDGDIEVAMHPRLTSQECVDGPTTVHMHLKAVLPKAAEEIEHLFGAHRPSV